MQQCPFCVSYHPHTIHQTQTEYVIYSIRPGENKGRSCVIPKRHVEKLSELSIKETASFFTTVRMVTKKLTGYLLPEGFNFGLNEGRLVGQTISHLHFHIIPRYKGDGLPPYHLFHRSPKDKQNLSEKEIQSLVQEFKQVFKRNQNET